MLRLMWEFGRGRESWWFEFAKRYSGYWIVGTGPSLWQKKWTSISAFISLRSLQSLRVSRTQLPCP